MTVDTVKAHLDAAAAALRGAKLIDHEPSFETAEEQLTLALEFVPAGEAADAVETALRVLRSGASFPRQRAFMVLARLHHAARELGFEITEG